MSASAIVVLGAGGLGREVLAYACDAERAGWPHRVRGFADDNPSALVGVDVGVDVLGPLRDHSLLAGDVIIAAGDPLMRRELRMRVAAAGGRLVSLVHPSTYVAADARIGDGAVIAPGAFVGVGATVSANAVVNVLASVGHDVVVGVDSVLSPHAALSGASRIGEAVLLGTHSTLTPGVQVGDWSKVAAGAVVSRDAPPGSLVAGNPAKGRVIFAHP